MNPLPLPGADTYARQGWIVSAAVHGFVVFGAMVLLSDLTPPPQPEPFKWDVAVVEPEAEVNPTPVPAQPAQPQPPKTTPPKPRPLNQAPTEPKPIVRKVETIEPQPVQQVVQREVLPGVHSPVRSAAQEVQRPAEQAVQHVVERVPDVRPVTAEVAPLPKSKPITHEVVATAAPILHQETSPMEQVEQETTAARQEAPVIRQETTVVRQETTVVRQEMPIAHQDTIMETAAESVIAEQVAQAANPSVEHRTVETLQQAAVTTAPSTVSALTESIERPVDRTPQPVQQQVAALSKPTEAEERALQGRANPRADFSWLAQDLRHRIEQLKRYPHLARMNRWEGKVVVQAVIREDGQLIDLKVTESSGHTLLDEAAMDVMRQVSPLHLKHPLGRTQVVVQVPINYRLQN